MLHLIKDALREAANHRENGRIITHWRATTLGQTPENYRSTSSGTNRDACIVGLPRLTVRQISSQTTMFNPGYLHVSGRSLLKLISCAITTIYSLVGPRFRHHFQKAPKKSRSPAEKYEQGR